ncbi:hypothetical protein AB1Y20_017156 [Prymnesium parvum]|uniref:Protein kinase domain-containing protein n=1 Tax=Prymnesium parvum TaxID=97485 RepID=A0AB34I8W7_PRYPA
MAAAFAKRQRTAPDEPPSLPSAAAEERGEEWSGERRDGGRDRRGRGVGGRRGEQVGEGGGERRGEGRVEGEASGTVEEEGEEEGKEEGQEEGEELGEEGEEEAGRWEGLWEEVEQEDGEAVRTPAPPLPSDLSPPASEVCDLSDVTFVRPISRGAHSQVWLVKQRTHAAGYFALKLLSKARLAAAGPSAARDVSRELRALLLLSPHPFLPTLHAAWDDRRGVYLLLSLALGGDLRGLLLKERRRRAVGGAGGMDEASVRFYAAVIVLVLEHIHSRGFVYRDLKPSNLLLDAHGHPLLADFGAAAPLGASGRAMSALGTWEYAAPELLRRRGATPAADWWAAGVVTLECLAGGCPFPSGDADEPRAVLSAAAPIAAHARAAANSPSSPPSPIPRLLRPLSPAARSLLLLLLHPSERHRLAAAPSLRAHPFFAPIDWRRLARREEPPPRRPTILGAADTRNFSHCSLDEEDAAAVGAPLGIDWRGGEGGGRGGGGEGIAELLRAGGGEA